MSSRFYDHELRNADYFYAHSNSKSWNAGIFGLYHLILWQSILLMSVLMIIYLVMFVLGRLFKLGEEVN
jgi:hypothetical protein